MGVRFAQDVGWAKGLWFGLFHSVSAFNNAGFALFSDNLMGYRGDLTINLVITTLIIAGGLGFFVLSGLLRLRKRTAVGMSVHTKLVLTVTALPARRRHAGHPGARVDQPEDARPARRRREGARGVLPGRHAAHGGVQYDHRIGDMTSPALFLTIILMFIGASPGRHRRRRQDHHVRHRRGGPVVDRAGRARHQRVQAPPAAGPGPPGVHAVDPRGRRPPLHHRPAAA